METLVVVAQHRNQYYSRASSQGAVGLGSPLSVRDFRGTSCRSFESTGPGILPFPYKGYDTPVSKQPCSSPKTPSSASETKTSSGRAAARSAPIAIDSKATNRRKFFSGEFSGEMLSFSERWAGPAYSNSPPPSSLPMPKFSVQPKRTGSLQLPGSSPEVRLHPIARSAPASPTRELGSFARDIFHSADSATDALRRILNLDISDERAMGEGAILSCK